MSKVYDVIQGLAYPEKEIRDLFHVDVIDSGTGFLSSKEDWVEWRYKDNNVGLIPRFLNIEEDKKNGDEYLVDEYGVRLAIKPKTSFFFDQIFWIYEDRDKIPEILNDQDLNQHMWAIPSPPWHYDIKFIDKVLKGVGDYINIIMFSEDLGSQNGPFYSRDIFRRVFKPKYKKMYDYVHENSNCKILLHTCGSVYELLPDLVDIGLDILNPIQTTAKDMEPERLKKEFGKDLTFWGGGCNIRDILPSKSPKEVKEDVKRRIEILSKGGGFVFTSIHNILPEVPPENIIAMYEAANEYGTY